MSELKTRQTACYFCNDLFDFGQLQVQDDAGDMHGLSQSTVSRICAQVAACLASRASIYINMPSSLNDQAQVIQKFKRIRNFPGVIGAIDCTHIKIKKVGGDRGQYYINRKGYFSLNVQLHLQNCGSILEQCSLRCGAWIQRRNKEKHSKECPEIKRNRRSVTPMYASQNQPSPESIENGIPIASAVEFLEKELTDMRLELRKDAIQRDIQLGDVENLKAKLVLADDRNQHFLSTLVGLQTSLENEIQKTSTWTNQFKHDIINLQLTLQELHSAQMSLTMRLDNVVSTLDHEQTERDHIERALQNHDRAIGALQGLDERLEELKSALEHDRHASDERRLAMASQNEQALAAEAQIAHIGALRAELNQHGIIEQYMSEKHQLLEVECRTLKSDVESVVNATAAIVRDVKGLSKSYLKLRDDYTNFKQSVTLDHLPNNLGSDDGHLIWRIEDFTAKMKDAKEKDTVLTSPLFRTSKYGYTLKAEVYFNGIGKWKSRYVAVTVRLVQGPYDPLLEWPCDLLVNIVLKDQAPNRAQAMDVVKTLHIRRKTSKSQTFDDTSESTEDVRKSLEDIASATTNIEMKRQYIFIPHHSLDKLDYTRDNVLFFEFCAKQ